VRWNTGDADSYKSRPSGYRPPVTHTNQSPPPPFCFMNKRLNSNHTEAAAYFLVVLAAGAGAPLVAPPEAPDLVAEFCDLRFEACSSRAFLASFFLITTRSWYFFASSLEAMAFSRLNWRSERLRCFF
jgi:hypothetical protein